jgi:hypothetical protein
MLISLLCTLSHPAKIVPCSGRWFQALGKVKVGVGDLAEGCSWRTVHPPTHVLRLRVSWRLRTPLRRHRKISFTKHAKIVHQPHNIALKHPLRHDGSTKWFLPRSGSAESLGLSSTLMLVRNCSTSWPRCLRSLSANSWGWESGRTTKHQLARDSHNTTHVYDAQAISFLYNE